MHSVRSIRLPALCAGALLLAGCVTRSSSLAPIPDMPLRPPEGAPVVHAPEVAQGPLTLARLLEMAEQHPDLASARARADSARGRLIQAGLYPNPTVTGRIDELGNPKNSLGFPAVTLTQVIVTHRKIPLAKAAAAAGVDAADWQAMTFWYAVRLRTQQAYYELLTAEREVEATRELQRIAEQALAGAEKLLKGGTGTQLDVLRAQVDRNQSEVRAAVSRRRLEAAGRLLATAVGLPRLPGAPSAEGTATPVIVGTLDGPTPALEWEELREAMLLRTSEVQEARALVFQAERLLKSARAAAKPDVTVSVRPIYSAPDRTTEVLVEVGAPIPIFNRNQGNIYAAEADLARAAADSRAVELRVTERLTAAYQRYQVARRQVTEYEGRILPDAKEALRLVRLGYERGDAKYDLTAVLQAQQALATIQLAQVQARGDLWRALSEIGALLQQAGPWDRE